MTIYIDSLFFTNFFMDTAILVTVSSLIRSRATTFRIFLGSFFSAVYGTLIFFPNLSFLYTAVFKVFASFIFVYITFGANNFKDFLRSVSAFWFISAATGGIIFAISAFSDTGTVLKTMVSNGVFYLDISPILLASGCGLLYILTEVYRRSCIKNLSRKAVILDIEITYLGRQYELVGLIDTGCTLTEPLGGAPVIIAESRVFHDIPAPQNTLYAKTAAGDCYLRYILPEKVVCKTKGYTILNETVVALTDSQFNDGIYNALINPLATEECLNTQYERTECLNE